MKKANTNTNRTNNTSANATDTRTAILAPTAPTVKARKLPATLDTNTHATDTHAAALALTVNGDTHADLETANGFETLKRTFERDYHKGDYADTLTALATATAAAVLRRLVDPDARQAANRDRISTSGQSPVMLALRREVYDDTESLSALRDCTNRASRLAFNADGDIVREVVDKAADRAAAALAAERLGDGCDLVNEAAAAILEQCEAQEKRTYYRYFDEHDKLIYEGWEKPADVDKFNTYLWDDSYCEAVKGCGLVAWLDTPVAVRRLAKRTYADREAVATWKDAESTPIQEVFRAVRRYIANTRAVQTDTRNGYAYIADIARDDESGTVETIYCRIGKFADLGGYAANGRTPEQLAGAPAWYASGDACGDGYTVGAATVDRVGDICAALNLSARENAVLNLRLRGLSTVAIAKRLGIGEKTVRRAVADMQDRAAACGFAPRDWNAADRQGDAPRGVEKLDTRTGEMVDTFDSLGAAALCTGINKGSIGAAASGKRKSAGGFAWRFID